MARVDFNKFTKPQDPEVIKLWQHGIVLKDPIRVEEAIAKNIDVNTSYASYGDSCDGYNAVENLLTAHSYLYGKGRSLEDLKKIEDITKIVHMILNENPDLTVKSTTGTCILDRIAENAKDKNLAADVIIASLAKQALYGQALYQIGINEIFSGIGAEGHGIESRKKAHKNLTDVHDIVRMKLENPSHIREIDLVKNYADKLAYWTKPLAIPDPEFLPRASQESMDAVKRLGETVSELGALTSRFLETRDPGTLSEALYVIRDAHTDSLEATRQLRKPQQP